MYPVLQQQAIPYQFMYPVLQRQQVIPYQFMLIRKNTNRFCIRNQNEKHEQQQYASLRSKPARDRVIDFGKYKGKMLGSLPSKYLKWVSKNLRTQDFEGWAILADQVLVDPIYRDRIEWEFALNVLDGNSGSRSTEPAGSQLDDISDRFGWDNLDRIGWSKVDFNLLGTSRGGRIPRLGNPSHATNDSKPNLPPATTSITSISGSRSRRMERRRSRTTHEAPQEQKQQHKEDDTVVPVADNKQVANPFPGRLALLRKAINHRAQS